MFGGQIPSISRPGVSVAVLTAALLLADCRAREHSAAGRAGERTGGGTETGPRTLVIEMTVEESGSRDGHEYVHRSGRGTKWIDVAGNRRRDDFRGTVRVLDARPKEVSTTLLFDGKTAYSVMTVDGRQTAASMADLTDRGKAPSVAKEGVISSLDGLLRKRGHAPTAETFLGRSCVVFGLTGSTQTQTEWIWNGVLVKSEVQSPDRTVLEQATRIEENVPIDAERFAPPSGVHFQPAPAGQAGLNPADRRPWAQPLYMRAFGGP